MAQDVGVGCGVRHAHRHVRVELRGSKGRVWAPKLADQDRLIVNKLLYLILGIEVAHNPTARMEI